MNNIGCDMMSQLVCISRCIPYLQEELKRKENEYEIVDFIVSKFKGAVGLGKGPDLPPMNRETEGMVGGK